MSDVSPRKTVSDLLGPEFKSLMAEMALMFPQMPGNLQEQARQAHSHVQELLHGGHYQQAMNLMTHMRDIMRNLTVSSPTSGIVNSVAPQLKHETPLTPPFIAASPPGINMTGITNVSPAAVEAPSSPPVPDSSSAEMVALKRTIEDLQMRMQENSAVTLIAKRVRDMEMEQKYATLEAQLRELKRSVADRLDRIKNLIDDSEVLARVQIRKRTVSRNPFCEHGPGGQCDFCVGKEMEDADFLVEKRAIVNEASRPPKTINTFAEDLTNHEMILNMQNTLKTYQGMLKELLQERKEELQSRKDVSAHSVA